MITWTKTDNSWFVPIGTELELRIERGHDGYWSVDAGTYQSQNMSITKIFSNPLEASKYVEKSLSGVYRTLTRFYREVDKRPVKTNTK